MKNWQPVIQSLLQTLVAAGFTLHGVDDGGEFQSVTSQEEAVAAICAVDESTLHIIAPNEKNLWLFLVLGNEPSATVCDYRTGDPHLDCVLEEWSDSWDGKECPEIPPADEPIQVGPPEAPAPADPAIISAMRRLITAAHQRETMMGDPIGLIARKAELEAAAKAAEAAIANAIATV